MTLSGLQPRMQVLLRGSTYLGSLTNLLLPLSPMDWTRRKERRSAMFSSSILVVEPSTYPSSVLWTESSRLSLQLVTLTWVERISTTDLLTILSTNSRGNIRKTCLEISVHCVVSVLLARELSEHFLLHLRPTLKLTLWLMAKTFTRRSQGPGSRNCV